MARRQRGIVFDNPQEREVFHAKESWIPVVLGAVPYLVVGIACWLVAWRVFEKGGVGGILLAVCVAVGLITRIPRIIANLDTDVIVTDKRLYARTGIVDIKDQVCDLTNVSDVTVDPTVFGRIFDYADVRIQTYAGDEDFLLKGIAHAYEMRRAISQGSDAARDGRPRPASARQRRPRA